MTERSGMDNVAKDKTRLQSPVWMVFAVLAVTLMMAKSAAASSAPVALLKAPGIEKSSKSIDLAALEKKIANTDAITVFAKLSLKSGIETLTNEAGQIRKGQSSIGFNELKQRFEEFLYSTVAMLRKGDPSLADELAMSRDELWKVLADLQYAGDTSDD